MDQDTKYDHHPSNSKHSTRTHQPNKMLYSVTCFDTEKVPEYAKYVAACLPAAKHISTLHSTRKLHPSMSANSDLKTLCYLKVAVPYIVNGITRLQFRFLNTPIAV